MEISNKKIFSLALPIILSNISIPLLDGTNTYIVGHLSSPIYLAALALGLVIINFIYVSFYFLRLGTTGITAQCFGRNNNTGVIYCLLRGVILATVLGLSLTFLSPLISKIGFSLLNGNVDVELYAKNYFSIQILGMGFILNYFVIQGWLLGIQKPYLSVILQLGMNLLNIILALIFTSKFNLNITGIALSSLISEITFCIIGFIAAIFLIRTNFSKDFKFSFSELFNLKDFKHIIKLHGNIFIRCIFLISTFAWFANLGAKQGNIILAANEILLLFLLFFSFSLDGFAQAAEILVGSSIGEKNLKSLDKTIKLTTLWALIFAIIFSIGYFSFGDKIVDMLTNIKDVRIIAKEYLHWMVWLPLIGIWCYELDGIFIGATLTKEIRNTMLIAFSVFAISQYFFVERFRNNGLWLSLTLFLITRALVLGSYLKRVRKLCT